MIACIRCLIFPILSLTILLLASGPFNTFVSLRLAMAGHTPEMIGVVTSSLYFGILLGSSRIPGWIGSIGHIRAFSVCAASLSAFVLLQGLWINAWFWLALRFLGGLCLSGIFIAIESWVLMLSPPRIRGKVLSIYLAISYAALSGGQLLINLTDPKSLYPFCITAIFLSLSILPVAFYKIQEPKITETIKFSPLQIFKISPYGFTGGVTAGMVASILFGLVPIYAKSNGMSLEDISVFMALIVFGGLCLQAPMGYFADRGERRKILHLASLLTAGIAVAIGYFDHQYPYLILVLGWLFGGFAFTLYPLSLGYVNDKLDGSHIVAATSGFFLCYGLGAITGPLLAPFAMTLFGSAGLFYFLAAITFLLFLVGFKKPRKPVIEEPTPTQSSSPPPSKPPIP